MAMVRRRSPGITVDGLELRRQLALRGLRSCDLAQLAQITPSVVSGAIGGRPISAPTAARICGALARVPPVAEISGLIQVGGGG